MTPQERIAALRAAVERNLRETREMSPPDKVALSAVHANEFTLADLAWLLAIAEAAVALREADVDGASEDLEEEQDVVQAAHRLLVRRNALYRAVEDK